MIFTSTFSRVDSKPSIPSVSKQSATEKEKRGKQSRESAPDWSTLQAIPIPEDHVRKVNEYLLKISEKSGEKSKKDAVKQRYSRETPFSGVFLRAVA